jgi:hypothetical protein
MRLRQIVAIMVAIGILLRLAAPVPATASFYPSTEAQLALLGATLCHSDDTSGIPSPADPANCDHCPLCAATAHASWMPVLTALNLPRPSLIVVPSAVLSYTAVHPRAPPLRANPPRAPPAV